MTYSPPQTFPLTAFGELSAESKHPEIQVLFQYGINPQLTRSTLVSLGTITPVNQKAVVSSGAAASSSAMLESEEILTYKAGQGWLVFFTALFTGTPAVGNNRFIGYGEKDVDGFFFGYKDTVFGILHLQNGTSTFIPQSSWNRDNADGTGSLPNITSWTNGNVFKIQGQHLAFGGIDCFIEDTITKRLILVHRFEYANSSTLPSQANPSNPIILYSENTTNTTDLAIESASMAAFIEGNDVDIKLKQSIDISYTGNPTNENILTIRGKALFGGIKNKVVAKVLRVSASTDGTKNASIAMVINGTFTGTPVWVDVDTASSSLEYDVAGVYTATTGKPALAFDFAKVDSDRETINNLSFEIRPQDTVSFIANSSANTDIKLSVLMNEEL